MHEICSCVWQQDTSGYVFGCGNERENFRCNDAKFVRFLKTYYNDDEICIEDTDMFRESVDWYAEEECDILIIIYI